MISPELEADIERSFGAVAITDGSSTSMAMEDDPDFHKIMDMLLNPTDIDFDHTSFAAPPSQSTVDAKNLLPTDEVLEAGLSKGVDSFLEVDEVFQFLNNLELSDPTEVGSSISGVLQDPVTLQNPPNNTGCEEKKEPPQVCDEYQADIPECQAVPKAPCPDDEMSDEDELLLGPCDWSETDDDERKEPRVGDEYQAVIPECRPFGEVPCSEDEMPDQDELTWDPSYLSEEKMEEYASQVQKQAQERTSIWDQIFLTEESLRVLHEFDYDTEKAIHHQNLQTSVPSSILSEWSAEEIKDFQAGRIDYGKNFTEIQKNYLPHRSVKEVVQFYYAWKSDVKRSPIQDAMRTLTKELEECPLEHLIAEHQDNVLPKQCPGGLDSPGLKVEDSTDPCMNGEERQYCTGCETCMCRKQPDRLSGRAIFEDHGTVSATFEEQTYCCSTSASQKHPRHGVGDDPSPFEKPPQHAPSEEQLPHNTAAGCDLEEQLHDETCDEPPSSGKQLHQFLVDSPPVSEKQLYSKCDDPPQSYKHINSSPISTMRSPLSCVHFNPRRTTDSSAPKSRKRARSPVPRHLVAAFTLFNDLHRGRRTLEPLKKMIKVC